jgi:hypothetical protein
MRVGPLPVTAFGEVVMTGALCEVLVALAALGAPVPKGAEVAVAPPPRPLVQFHALLLVGGDPHNRHTSYGLFDTNGPQKDTFVPIHNRVQHVALDPNGKTLYGINSNDMFVVSLDPPGRKPRNHFVLDPTLKREGWMCGIAFDTKRNRVVVVSLAGKGAMYAFDVKTEKWEAIADMNNLDLVALTYSPKTDMLYGLYQSFNNPNPTIGAFDPVTGALRDEIVLNDANFPRDLGQARGGVTTAQMAAVGNHLMLLTDTHMYRLDLKTNKITVEWKR